jgi:hypothetical protein
MQPTAGVIFGTTENATHCKSFTTVVDRFVIWLKLLLELTQPFLIVIATERTATETHGSRMAHARQHYGFCQHRLERLEA